MSATENTEEKRGLDVESLHNQVVKGECVNVLSKLPDDTVDCVVADPPYNLSKGGTLSWSEKSFEKTDEDWDDMGWDEYQAFTRAWIREAKRVLKPSGSIWTFGSYHNIGLVNVAYLNLGIEKLNEIVWFKRNAFPNMTGSRFTASHENILWGTPRQGGDSGDYTFNYQETRDWPCESSPVSEENKQLRSVWNIPTNKSQIEQEYDHPTQKPLRVLERIIRASTTENDTVLDPFAGSGSTLVSAKLNNRNWIGIEREEQYVETAREFVRSVVRKPDSVVAETGIPN